MRSFHVRCVALIAVLGACASPADEADDADESAQIRVTPAGVDPQGDLAPGARGAPEPGEGPMLGVHHARNAGTSGTAAPGNMTSHGGAIMTSSAVTTIFWGKSWASSSFAGDKIAGLNRLYAGLASATSYVASNAEYSGTNGQVGASVTYAGTKLDTSAAPTTSPCSSPSSSTSTATVAAIPRTATSRTRKASPRSPT